MQTHCPKCATQFRVTEQQINIAGGLVRCGVCENVFNVLEVNGMTTHEYLQSFTDSKGPDEFPTEETPANKTATEDATDIQTDSKHVSFYENKKPAADKIQKDSLDFFNEEITVSLPHVVPEKFRKQETSKLYSATSTVLWSIGTLLLTACLLLEHVWFNRHQYNKSTELQAVIEKLCKQFECKNLSMRDPSKIELVARNVYTHPNEKGALMVDFTMKNNAKFSQPYPVMNISFSDIRGNAVASRNFLPKEYLSIENIQSDKKQLDLLQPDVNISLSMEIQDPGKQATTYEFNFL